MVNCASSYIMKRLCPAQFRRSTTFQPNELFTAMTVPNWVQDAIFYQIFPDRFANGDPSNDPPNVHPWGAAPTLWGFQGGDLRGVIEKFDYLLDLGINAIYFNPIFLATSNHRYNTSDYYHIDPKLGDMDDFRALLETAHWNNVRVVLDGVFNHSGRGFFAFNDILENREHSPYKNWFHVNDIPLDAYSPGEAMAYEGWWGFKSLPKFNTDNPQMCQYLFNVARYWIEQGADGWRLDVPNEIDNDEFWDEFRHTVKSVNPDAYLFGEIWDGNPRWVGESQFDGLMNYLFRDTLRDFLKSDKLKASSFADKVEGLLDQYPREHAYAMYLPLGSHDTERLFTLLDGDLNKVKLAFLFQFAYPGAPAIYYGDEIGMEGERDPDCRGAFPWDKTSWNISLRDWVKRLIRLRKRHPAMRQGGYKRLVTDDSQGCYAFARTFGDQVIVVALNASGICHRIGVPIADLGWQEGYVVGNLLRGEEYTISGEMLALTLQPWEGIWVG